VADARCSTNHCVNSISLPLSDWFLEEREPIMDPTFRDLDFDVGRSDLIGVGATKFHAAVAVRDRGKTFWILSAPSTRPCLRESVKCQTAPLSVGIGLTDSLHR